MACTVISIVLASRLLRLENDEFFKVFNNPSNETVAVARTILNGCLEAGIKLKSKISPGLFGGWKKSDIASDVTKISQLSENIAGSKDLEIVGDTQAIALSDETRKIGLNGLESVSDMLNSKDANDVCFVVTANGHTTVFFSIENDSDKQRYFVSIDSFPKTLFEGKFELHDNFDSLIQSLILKWGSKTQMVDVTTIRLHQNPDLTPSAGF